MLRPSSNFRVIKRGNDIAIDPRSYARYDTLAAAAASMDPAGSARLYATLKPRIEEAARELGDSSFDRTLERALVQLLSTPAVNDPILLQSKGIGFGFADPKLENLTVAQKHLLRTGPATRPPFRARSERSRSHSAFPKRAYRESLITDH